MPPTISCPHCGHHFNGSREAKRLVSHYITDTPTFSVDQEDDVTVALEGLHRLDDLIHQLNQDKTRLFRRINNVQAATRHLPLEVLSTIFQLACPPIDFGTRSTPSELSQNYHLGRDMYREDDFQFVLGAVSYQWRQAAWATSQLWTTVSVKIYETGGENKVSLLNLYFENSRSHPMIVELDCRARLPLLLDPADSKVLKESTLLLESIETSLLNNAARIRDFRLTGVPAEWTSHICKNLLRCESMTLCWPSSSSYRRRRSDCGLLDLTKLSNLHHLHMNAPDVPFSLPWSTITTLQLSGVPIGQSVKSLAKCPNLIKFENFDCRPESSPPSLNQRVTLKHLESLTWCADKDPWDVAFLRHMRFSKLRVLTWTFRPYVNFFFSEQFYHELEVFFFSLPETLQVLKLADDSNEYRVMKTILTSVPRLAELVLIADSELTYLRALSMIGRPAAGLSEDPANRSGVVALNQLEGPKVLPCLRKLTLLNVSTNPRPEDVAEMLEALHGARVMWEPFCFEVMSSRVKNTWSSEVLARLKQLAESGFEFEIFQGSRRLDYMSHSIDARGLG